MSRKLVRCGLRRKVPPGLKTGGFPARTFPGMNGYEVASRLREEGFCEKALMVALSGYGQEEDWRLSRAAGFDHHLVKPVDIDVVIKLLAGAPAQTSAGPNATSKPMLVRADGPDR